VKRFVLSLFALFATAFLITPAEAGKWVTKEIKWQISNQGAPTNAGAIYIRDTLYTALGPVDTTANFSLDDADPIPRGVVAPGISEQGAVTASGFAYQSDTTVVAYVVLQSDSSAAPTSGLTSATMLVDGRVGGFGPATTLARGWVKADSTFVNGAAGGTMITGDESIAFPIRSISPYGNIRRWGTLRARISAAGTALSAVRVFLRYWDND
jgi:hypothetical protein